MPDEAEAVDSALCGVVAAPIARDGYAASVRVIDCLGIAFATSCRALGDRVAACYEPDLLVGIRQGGSIVADEMTSSRYIDADRCDVSARRRGTVRKSQLRLHGVTSKLPLRMRNQLRSVEHHVRVLSQMHSPPERDIGCSSLAVQAIESAERILVVDDAVDSGQTLKAVLDLVRALGYGEVRSAALTVTFPAPVVEPDFWLYRGVLLRFPWSMDAVGN